VWNAVHHSCSGVCCDLLPIPHSGLHCSHRRQKHSYGFTLVELLIVIAIVLTVASIAIPDLLSAIDLARVARAVSEIHTFEDAITNYDVINGQYPDSLANVGYGGYLDPWGNPYEYLNHATMKGNGKARKDRFLVPLNSDYDLYSVGKDGKSVSPITAKASQDDIIRASDGSYVGLASQF
jgi:general secretion pathway protein G